MEKIKLFKELLSVPTYSRKEERMIDFISRQLEKMEIPYFVDEHGNIYATKGEIGEEEYFPCVVSHTDTVHDNDKINVVECLKPNKKGEIKVALRGVDDEGSATGIGGDDKCGIFICLRLLEELPKLKAAFFVSEEIGCVGSFKADKGFFGDVGYAIQFDAPENDLITYTCMGIPLFERDSLFIAKIDPVLTEGFGENKKFKHHPYTDVHALRHLFEIDCINISCGYYDYHTENEYIILEDVITALNTGKGMISELGYNKFHERKVINE